jgi:hypothetical protein
MLSLQVIQSGFHSAKIWAIWHKAWVMQKTGFTPSGKLLRVGVAESVLMTLAVLFLTGIHWKLEKWRDRAIFALVAGLALGLHIWVDKISWWVLYEVIFSEVERTNIGGRGTNRYHVLSIFVMRIPYTYKELTTRKLIKGVYRWC